MADYDLDRLLVQVRRIEEHREKGAEAEIRKTYQELLKELRHYLADTYSQYAEDDRLDYRILQQHSYYARFLEEVEKKINDISPEVKQLIRSTADQTYERTYNGMIDCVKKAASDVTVTAGLKACTPDVIRRAVENPVSKLTLNDRLEKHRKEIIYDIKQDISVGLMNGDRYSTMANRVKQSVEGDYKKAIRIARTETHRVREAGNHDAAQSVDEVLKTGESGMRMVKTWRTMKDERVRPAKSKGKNRKYDHRKMDGVALPVEEEFTLPSGAKTLAPGQSGVAGEDINCRCYLSYGLKKADKSAEYLIRNHEGVVNSTEERLVANEAIASVPIKVQKKIHEGTIIDVGKIGTSQYDYTRDILYVAKGAEKEDIVHEIGHMAENKMMDSGKISQIRKKIIGEVDIWDIKTETYYDNEGNPIDIFLLKNDRFVSPYQGRIYADTIWDAFDNDGNFRDELMMEFVSEPFREYVSNPVSVKSKCQELYDLIEEAVK